MTLSYEMARGAEAARLMFYEACLPLSQDGSHDFWHSQETLLHFRLLSVYFHID